MGTEPRPQNTPLSFGLPDDFQMDVFLVAEGVRSLGKFEEVMDKRVDRACNRLEKNGLRTRAVAGPGKGVSDVFFARNHRSLEKVHTLERNQRLKRNAARRSRACRALGELLGYPACCVESFISADRQNDEERLLSFSKPLSQTIDARLNFFPRNFAPTSHLPCAPNCAKSLKRAQYILEVMEDRLDVEASAVVHALEGVIAWYSGPHFLFFRKIRDVTDSGFSYDEVHGSHEFMELPRTTHHRKAIQSLDNLKEKIDTGDRLELTETGAVVYSGQDEVFHWEQTDLQRHMLHFAAADV